MLLSHHKGRKRIHLEIVDRISKASDLKRKMVGVFKDTVSSLSTLVESYTYVFQRSLILPIFPFVETLQQQQHRHIPLLKWNTPMMMKVTENHIESMEWKVSFIFQILMSPNGIIVQ